MPPSTKSPAAAVRAVEYVEFTEAVEFPGMDFVRRLEAGKVVPRGGYPGGVPCECPPMWRDTDNGELVIGGDRFPLAGGLIKRYRLAKAAKGPSVGTD